MVQEKGSKNIIFFKFTSNPEFLTDKFTKKFFIYYYLIN